MVRSGVRVELSESLRVRARGYDSNRLRGDSNSAEARLEDVRDRAAARGDSARLRRVGRTKRLLVVGDVMLDRYIWGEVGRISPEAPVPVVRATHQSHQPGGAANVAMNIAKLGAQVEVIGFAGGDDDEQLLAACLRESGIVPGFVKCDGFPTITKLRILGGRQQMLRLDSERPGARGAGGLRAAGGARAGAAADGAMRWCCRTMRRAC